MANQKLYHLLLVVLLAQYNGTLLKLNEGTLYIDLITIYEKNMDGNGAKKGKLVHEVLVILKHQYVTISLADMKRSFKYFEQCNTNKNNI